MTLFFVIEENLNHACMDEDLTTADQSEIYKVYLVFVIRKVV